MIHLALHARCFCDQQREAAIEDQLCLCRLYAKKQGWVVAESSDDRAISGAPLLRFGVQALPLVGCRRSMLPRRCGDACNLHPIGRSWGAIGGRLRRSRRGATTGASI